MRHKLAFPFWETLSYDLYGVSIHRDYHARSYFILWIVIMIKDAHVNVLSSRRTNRPFLLVGALEETLVNLD
jgi:hypothetical protein